MLRSERTAIPQSVEARLQRLAAFSKSPTDFARDDLVGFRRPLAAVFALTAPIIAAFVFHTAGIGPTVKTAALYTAYVAIGLVIVGRLEWPRLLEAYEEREAAKKRANADLKCGFSQVNHLRQTRAPMFVEYDHGVLVLADAGDLRTLFFSIPADDRDPRWERYRGGDLHRRDWRWSRLPVSGEIYRFSTLGPMIERPRGIWRVSSIDEWEALHVSFRDPQDGDLLPFAFDDLAERVSQMVEAAPFEPAKKRKRKRGVRRQPSRVRA
ncbi:MAG: hypothetical protein AAGC56_08400 [Pseudomonadota bacterium]